MEVITLRQQEATRYGVIKGTIDRTKNSDRHYLLK